MKLNKAPGLDGLSVEFYRKFWNNLKNLITKVFNFNYERGHLSNSQKIGAISLIFKKNDPLSLDNYRPITFLNTDTRFQTIKAVENLLLTLIPSSEEEPVMLSDTATCLQQCASKLILCMKSSQ